MPLRVEHRKVRDVMTRHVHAVAPATPFATIVRLIEENRIGALPVVEARRVIGIVSKGDLLPKIERFDLGPESLLAAGPMQGPVRKAEGIRAKDLMTSPAVTIAETATLAEAARCMRTWSVRRLPVVDGNASLQGIVTRGDLLRVFLRSDDEIQREIVSRVLPRAVFEEELPEVKVEVEGGIVQLRGRVHRRSDAELLAEIVEHLDGVVSVDARALRHAWDDLHPTSGVGS
jgi:CBS domain-containing protein